MNLPALLPNLQQTIHCWSFTHFLWGRPIKLLFPGSIQTLANKHLYLTRSWSSLCICKSQTAMRRKQYDSLLLWKKYAWFFAWWGKWVAVFAFPRQEANPYYWLLNPYFHVPCRLYRKPGGHLRFTECTLVVSLQHVAFKSQWSVREQDCGTFPTFQPTFRPKTIQGTGLQSCHWYKEAITLPFH